MLRLKPRYRTVIYLHYYEGYRTEEIGRLLGRSSATVRSQLARARAKLKELLNERFNSVDFDEAKRDVRPFIADSDKLSLWSKEFFCAITEEWKVG